MGLHKQWRVDLFEFYWNRQVSSNCYRCPYLF